MKCVSRIEGHIVGTYIRRTVDGFITERCVFRSMLSYGISGVWSGDEQVVSNGVLMSAGRRTSNSHDGGFQDRNSGAVGLTGCSGFKLSKSATLTFTYTLDQK